MNEEQHPEMQMTVTPVRRALRALRALGGTTELTENGIDQRITFPAGTTFSREPRPYSLCGKNCGKQWGVYIPGNEEGLSLIWEDPPDTPLTESRWSLTWHPYAWRDMFTLCDLWVNLEMTLAQERNGRHLCRFGFCLEDATTVCSNPRCRLQICAVKHCIEGMCRGCHDLTIDAAEVLAEAAHHG